MSYRKFFALSFLSVLWFAGCGDDSKKDEQPQNLCGNGVVDTGEECDGANLNNKTCASADILGDGATGTLSCSAECKLVKTACVAATETECNNNGTKDNGEECDGTDFGGKTCVDYKGANATGNLSCNACKINSDACAAATNVTCNNNGTKDADEECDGSDFGDKTCASYKGEGATGNLSCNACKINSDACVAAPKCGDGIKNKDDEQCDGSDFGGKTCVEYKGAGATGSLSCDNSCKIDGSACKAAAIETCGNGQLDEGEDCDLDNSGNLVWKDGISCNAHHQGAAGQPLCEGCVANYDSCSWCGNNRKDGQEDCDGTDLLGKTCNSLDSNTYGTLACSDTCSWDKTNCSTCNDPCNGETLFACVGENTAEYKVCTDGCWEPASCKGSQVCVADSESICCDANCAADDVTGIQGETSYTVCKNHCQMTKQCDPGTTFDTTQKKCVYPELEAGCDMDQNVNVLHQGTEYSVTNCTSRGQLCTEDGNNSDCKPHAFSCEGTVVTLTEGTKTYKYDCKQNVNSSIEDDKDKVVCNTADGCSSIYCDGNQLKLCNASGCELIEDCAVLGLTCSDAAKTCVADPPKETCSTINGQATYILATEDGYFMQLCPNGCAGDGKKCLMGCVGDKLYDDKGILDVDCAKYGLTCSESLKKCVSATEILECKQIDGFDVTVYANPTGYDLDYCTKGCNETKDGCISDSCVASTYTAKCEKENGYDVHYSCDDSKIRQHYCSPLSNCDANSAEGCVPKVGTTCGNDALDNGEACDIQVTNGIPLTMWAGYKYNGIYYNGFAYRPSCNYYDSTKVFKSGAPKCVAKSDKCTVDVTNNCVEATENDYVSFATWAEFNKSNIKNFEMHNVGNSGLGSGVNNGWWQLAKWPTGALNWDAYVMFDTSKARTNDYPYMETDNVAKVTFTAKRSDNGPAKIALKFYDGNKELVFDGAPVVTKDLVLNTKETNYTVIARFNIDPDMNLKFKVSAYGGGEGNDGQMMIKNIEVKTTSALSPAPVPISY